MAPLYDGHDYYKRMFELQEKLRKSEEDRIRLEERFNVLMRDSRNRHDVCINRLRMRYIQYLEEQRTRDERNHKLLTALDRVMNKLALIGAKKDRLNVLRKQYETYLLRAYANHRPPGSVTGDSGIASQNEDKYTKKTIVMAHPDLASAETRSVSSPRAHPGAPDPPQSSQPRPISASKFHDRVAVNASLNNSILTAVPLGATLDVDHRQTSVPHGGPHIYAHQYPRMVPSNYDESAPRNLQHVPDIRVSYAEPPVLSMDNMQPHAVSANRFFREHVDPAQIASGPAATARFPAGDTSPRYVGETSRSVPTPRQFDPSTLLRYHDANVLLADPRSRIREYDPSATVGPTLRVTGKSSTYRTGPDTNVANQIDPLPGYMDYILANSHQKSDDEGSIRSIASDDLDGLIRRNERLLWANADAAVKTPHRSPTAFGIDNANLIDDRTALLENELDRYISNIRKIHRQHGIQSLDEADHEQNTSGDLLNVSLSEDAVELPAEDRGARKERVPEEMGKILALASDLASRTANLKEVARDSAGQDDGTPTEVDGDGIRRDREIAKSDALEFKGKRQAEGRAGNEIREDVATHSAELDRPRGDTRIAKESWNNAADSAESRARDREIFTIKKDDANVGKATRMDEPKNAPDEKGVDLVTSKESNIDGQIDAVEELAPWDLASVQKKVCELHLDEPDEDRAAGKNAEDTMDEVRKEIASESPRFVEQSGTDGEVENARSPPDTLPRSDVETKRSDASEASETEREKETREPVEDAQNVPSRVSSQHSVDEPKVASQPDEELGEGDRQELDSKDETTEQQLRVDDQFEGVVKDGEYGVEQGYVEDPSQAQQYERQDQQYYDPNMPYEAAGNEEYERYADQGYAQAGQEYVEYVDGQYGQYPEESQQYQHYPEQYEQDPNQAYDYGYDPNQGYGDPGQQYDPDQQQGYENNPDNQAYDYAEQVPYDPNQTYDSAYGQEYKEEQRAPPDDEERSRAAEPTETRDEVEQRQVDPDSEHKSENIDDEDKSQRADVNGANQSKKKKDVIKSLLDSDTDTTIERNVSNTESDFDFN